MREMKDSGVEWIGEMPSDWDYLPLNRLFRERKVKNSGNVEQSVLSLSYGRIVRRDVSDNFGLLPESFESYNIVEPGNIVMRLTDLQNDQRSLRTGLVKEKGIITSAYVALEIVAEADSRFYHYLLHTYDVIKIIYGMGNGVRQNLKFAELTNLFLLVPSIAEQARIAAFLDGKCSKIDAIIARQQEAIEKLKEYKQSIIAEAVTKGLAPNVSMKDSGIEWIGYIPSHWDTYRIANLFREVSENGSDDLPILSVSINTGVSDRELTDDENERTFVRSEDKSKYKRVCPGDLTYNMMRAWQGAFGAVRVAGMVSPAYIVARPLIEIDSRYVEYLLRTSSATEEMHRYSRGIADFRLRLYWPEFKNIRICFPPVIEQNRISDNIDARCKVIESLIAEKELLITKLTEYKKALIYEAVTGKMEVLPSNIFAFPASIPTKKVRFAQAVLMSKAIDYMGKDSIGRVKLEKLLFTLEHHIGFDFDTQYVEEVAGPFDPSIYKCEGTISKRNQWFSVTQTRKAVIYHPAKDMNKYKPYFDRYFQPYRDEIERIASIFKPFNMDQAEIIATLYAVWNNALIRKESFTDDSIVDYVLNNWNESKRRFSREEWLRGIQEIRELDLIPKGYGKPTQPVKPH